MGKRLLKALSIPIVLVVLLIPIFIISGVIWVINGKTSPIKLLEIYFEWLEDERRQGNG